MRTKMAAAVAAMCLAAAPASADRWSIGFPGGVQIETDDGDRLRLRISEDGRTLKIDSYGHFELNEEETDVIRLDSGGKMRIEDRRRGMTTHRLELRGLPDGSIERDYERGDVREFDAQGREWLAGVLTTVLRNTSFDAEGHIERVLRRSGTDGALREIEHIDSDHTKRECYVLLLEKAPPDPALAPRIAESAGREFGSDHQLTELILLLMESQPDDPVLSAACVKLTPIGCQRGPSSSAHMRNTTPMASSVACREGASLSTSCRMTTALPASSSNSATESLTRCR